MLGKVCQDAFSADFVLDKNGSPILYVFVADGAGSAPFSYEGATIAVRQAVEFIVRKISNNDLILDKVLITNLVESVKENIMLLANNNKQDIKDYACTFLGLVSTSNLTIMVQIGDGAMVVDFGNGLELPILPFTGEYLNITDFITDDDSVSKMQFKSISKIVNKVAAFTDGLQQLAINFSTSLPHEPFFKPFFDAIINSPSGNESLLSNLLANFLDSDQVNQKTDDDKTLVLATIEF